MRKFFYALILAASISSCQNDDDQMVAICQIPDQISVTNITNTSVNITWQDASVTSYIIEYGTAGFQLGTGTTVSSITNSATITNLQANTDYQFYVQSFCDLGNTSMVSDMASFTTQENPVVAEFMPTLSQLNLFSGTLSNLEPSSRTLLYKINTPLFTDYTHKQRIIALPENTSMSYVDNMLPDFPDNTVIAKTFYQNVDDRDESLGRTIIETRVLIKKQGNWEIGEYVWNDDQSDAVLDGNGSTIPLSWIDENGNTLSTNYSIPTNQDCITCHQNNGEIYPVGPKLRSMNFNINGVNQLQKFINSGHLSNVSDISSITNLPNWEDSSETLEVRSRAYFDMNCAHCHAPGGYYDINYYSYFDFRYETSLEDSKIVEMRDAILLRMQNYQEGYSMPFIGTSIIHDEGVALIEEFINTL